MVAENIHSKVFKSALYLSKMIERSMTVQKISCEDNDYSLSTSKEVSTFWENLNVLLDKLANTHHVPQVQAFMVIVELKGIFQGSQVKPRPCCPFSECSEFTCLKIRFCLVNQ